MHGNISAATLNGNLDTSNKPKCVIAPHDSCFSLLGDPGHLAKNPCQVGVPNLKKNQ